MVVLCNRADHCIFALWFLSSFFSFLSFFSSPNISGRRWMSTIYFGTRCGLSANLECMFEKCCTRLVQNTGRKNRHSGTIGQLCRAVSSQLRHVSTIGKQLVKRLGSVTARHSSSGRQPNFAALNRGRHLCLVGRPSGWALAHILVMAVSETLRR